MHEINKLLDVTAENFVPGEFAGRVAKNSFSDLHKFQTHKRKYIESIPFSGHGLYNWYMRLPMTPEGKKARIQLYKAINDVLKARDITQTEAAELLGIRQAKISAIKMMRLDEFAMIFTIESGRQPNLVEKCLPPGATSPSHFA